MIKSFCTVLVMVSAFVSALNPGVAQRNHQRKELPENILVAYTTNKCRDDMTKVTKAIKEGVNVLIWSFVSFVPKDDTDEATVTTAPNPTCRPGVKIKAELDLSNYRQYREELRRLGFHNVVHLVAFGGWNGPHILSGYSSEELFGAFNDFNMQNNDNALDGPLFDGIDWDLEGHDDVQSSTNEFTKECLDQMGELSKLLKEDGFIVSMAPPESYLDITSHKFSRRVNLTYPEPWHKEFQYHGWNVYAYVLAKWNDSIDFIFIQFYESYSHAAYEVSQQGQSRSDFLINYCNMLVRNKETMYVTFEDDPGVHLQSQSINFPLSKLIFGFANGWALNVDVGDKTVFFPVESINIAFKKLALTGKKPRGVGFWVVEEEGNNGINYAKELRSILSNDELRIEES